MRTLLIFILSVLSCSAQMPFICGMMAQQPPPTSSNPPEYVATNVSGIYGWYPVDGNYMTSSGLATLTNLAKWTGAGDLTNQNAGTVSQPTYRASELNGKGIIWFDGVTNFLRSVNYTSPQPHEVWMVLSDTNVGSGRFYFSSVNSTYYNRFYTEGSTLYRLRSPTTVDSVAIRYTNKWMVLAAVFNGSSSCIYTNNVSMGAMSPGANGQQGFTLAASSTLGSFASFALAEMICYTNVLDRTWNGSASNVFNYLTNKYSISVP